MEESLVFLKPDAVLRKGIGAAILQEFLKNAEKFSVKAFKEIIVSEQLARKHYQEHEGKFFFPWLVKCLCAAPVLAMIIQGDIETIREFLGATFVQKAESDSIRGKYGIWGGVNSVHASDSPESGRRELELWKNFTSLNEDLEAPKKIKDYIAKWIETVKEENVIKLRDLCRNLAEGKSTREEVHREFIRILAEECPLSDTQTIRNFADIVIENVLL
ncbi:MAG: nucleoside-diphosphate kinase [Candidatus Helarchaeota archaeon]|nr:nucleoside-diphosphate kinase [Candidatus Helarchaeota archaeon]